MAGFSQDLGTPGASYIFQFFCGSQQPVGALPVKSSSLQLGSSVHDIAHHTVPPAAKTSPSPPALLRVSEQARPQPMLGVSQQQGLPPGNWEDDVQCVKPPAANEREVRRSRSRFRRRQQKLPDNADVPHEASPTVKIQPPPGDFLIRSVLSSVPRASVPAPIEAPPGKFGENARAFSASAIANPTQLEPLPGNLCKVPAARSLPLPVPPPPPPLLATVSAPSASIAPTSGLRTEHQTRLTPIVLRERADSVRLQVKAAPPLPEWAAYRTSADHCLQLAVSSKTDKDVNACKFSDSVCDMQVFDSAFLSSVHDLQHATMRLGPSDTFPSDQPLTAFMAYLFLVLHLRMNRYAERWLLFRYCDLRSKQSRKSAVRMYVRTWDSISFDAVEQTISFLLRLFAEPPPPQSMQFSLLQSFARMLQASGCPFRGFAWILCFSHNGLFCKTFSQQYMIFYMCRIVLHLD